MADFYGPWGNPNSTYRVWESVNFTQSIEHNRTDFTIHSYLQDQYGYGMWHGALRNQVWVRGGLYHNALHSIAGGANTSTLISVVSASVTHNNDGTLGNSEVASRLATEGGTWLYDGTASGVVFIPTIPRATTPTWVGNFTTGTAKTITLDRASGSFTHDVTWSFGSKSGTIATGAGTSTSWNPDHDLATEITGATSGTGHITVVTKNGGNVVGTRQVPFTLNLAASIIPTVSAVTWDDNNPVVKTNIGAFVQGLSLVKGAVTAAGVHGSSIVSKEVVIAGQTVPEGTGVPVASAGTITASGKATDSRGRVGTKAANFSVLAYAPPAATALQVRRALSNGTLNDQGTYLRVDVNAAASSLIVGSQKNHLRIKVFTKPSGSPEASWVERNNFLHSALTYNSNFLVGGGAAYPTSSSFDIRVELHDNALSIPVAYLRDVPTASVTFDMKGTQVGVGKMHERGGLDVFGEGYFSGEAYAAGITADHRLVRYGEARNASTLFNTGTVPPARLTAATETAIGAVERATQAEVNAGTDTSRYVTPATLRNAAIRTPDTSTAVVSLPATSGTLTVATGLPARDYDRLILVTNGDRNANSVNVAISHTAFVLAASATSTLVVYGGGGVGNARMNFYAIPVTPW